MGRLDHRVAVVTGASRGIGQAIAELFAAEGARVVAAARTANEGEHPLEGSLARTVANITAAGGEAIGVAANVSEEADCLRLIETAQATYGAVDVLVNDAALAYYAPVVDLPTSRWLRAFAVNLHGPFMLAKAALPGMIARRSGAIVNISAIAAKGPGRGPYRTGGGERPAGNALPGGVLYGTTKAALERFTQGLAEEVYEHGVSVTCISPSLAVPTPGTIYHGLVSTENDPWAEPPSMIARAALLLASEPLDRVTGRVAYSQQLLQEFGWISDGRGPGIDEPGSGYSQI